MNGLRIFEPAGWVVVMLYEQLDRQVFKTQDKILV